jgi:hypothetical protein
LEPLDQGIIFCFQQIHLDAGALGECFVELFIGVVVPA